LALVLALGNPLNGALFGSIASFDTLAAVPWVIGIMLATLLLCLLVAAGVAWSATRVRPLEVLRYE